MPKVEQMHSTAGNPVANQFIIYDDNTIYFQSYDSIIVKKFAGKVYLDETYWNYSGTTTKYRNIFLNETTKETKRKLSQGNIF